MEIKERLYFIISVQLNIRQADIRPELRLDGKEISFDSLDKVELVMALEEEFMIDMPDEETDIIKTVGFVFFTHLLLSISFIKLPIISLASCASFCNDLNASL
jgi:acyl carrier protein